MPTYTPTTWEDETPTTPIKYKITDDTAGVLADSAKIEVVTSVTAGTPLDATRLNKIEQGIKAVTDSDAAGVHVDVAGEYTAVTEKTWLADTDLVLVEDSAVSGAKKKAQVANLTPAHTRCKVTRLTAQSIPTGVATAVTFESEVFDTNAMWSTGAQVTIPADGVYLIVAQAVMAASTGGTARQLSIRLVGGEIQSAVISPPSGSGVQSGLHTSCIVPLSSGNKIQMEVYQNAGVALDLAATYGAPSLTVVRLA